jgi:hypothetical protein
VLKLFGGGLLASGLSLPISFIVAALLMWTRRNHQFWSPILSDKDLRTLGLYSTAVSLWPIVSLAVGATVGDLLAGRPIALGITSAAVSGLGLAAVSLKSFVQDRVRYAENVRLSEQTRQQLEPMILSRWRQLGGVPSDLKVDVKAFRTPYGTQGSVTLLFSSCPRPSTEVITQISPVVPAQFKLRVIAHPKC